MIHARCGVETVGGGYECTRSVRHKAPRSPTTTPASIIATPVSVTARPRRRRSCEPRRGKVQAMFLGGSAVVDRILLMINDNSFSATADGCLAYLSKIVIAVRWMKRRDAVTSRLCVNSRL